LFRNFTDLSYIKIMTKTILVAEDSPTEMRLVLSVLQNQGYTIITAVDGEDAIKKAELGNPQLAIIDVVMPKKNGFQVTRHLKTSAKTPDIKVILLTSKNQEADKFWGIRQGADVYLTKPFDSEMLLETVAGLI
jgi:twitching motility two-component system response regulator PilH